MDINFWGVVRGTRKRFSLKLKGQERRARHQRLERLWASISMPSQSAYNASKFAVRGYTEALRQELHGTSVNVMAVHPGGVRTNIVRNGRNRTDATGNAVGARDVSRASSRRRSPG